MSTETQTPPTPSGVRAAPRAAKGANDREEKIEILDPTPPIDPTIAHTRGVQLAGQPGQLQVQRPSADVIGSAVRPADDAKTAEEPAKVEYFRYIGERERKFKMGAGSGRDGYMATLRPGKVISSKDYPMASLKSQGFIPGRNLEPISAEEAMAS